MHERLGNRAQIRRKSSRARRSHLSVSPPSWSDERGTSCVSSQGCSRSWAVARWEQELFSLKNNDLNATLAWSGWVPIQKSGLELMVRPSHSWKSSVSGWIQTEWMSKRLSLSSRSFTERRPPSPLNHKSKPKSSLKCLAQDHTGQRPRMEADNNVCLNVPRTITLIDTFANSCSRFKNKRQHL
jgi:hypothetical protein